ncbi:hypothetical protein [Arthrobacter sp. RCC_34]|uniref:hypothetical protein n=1 Tax=Arthrobacter sp. RCC_34 TaxID=3239230 RepID=UPI0035263E04
MTPAILLKTLILLAAAVFVAAIVWRARRHPNRAKDFPERVRMPKLVAVVGWLFAAVGLLMGLVAFTSDDAENPLGFQISSLAIFIGCVLFLVLYRNWYVAAGTDEVAFRTFLGTEHVVPYGDVASYRVVERKGQPILTVTSIDGARLSLNIRTFDVAPLLLAIRFREANGRWPGRGELARWVRPGPPPSAAPPR